MRDEVDIISSFSDDDEGDSDDDAFCDDFALDCDGFDAQELLEI